MSDPNQNSTSTSAPSSTALEPVQLEGGLTSAPDSISELFGRDPLEWTEGDLNRMVKTYREQRIKLAQDEAKPKKTAAAKIPKEDLKGVSGEDLLNKLGLDL